MTMNFFVIHVLIMDFFHHCVSLVSAIQNPFVLTRPWVPLQGIQCPVRRVLCHITCLSPPVVCYCFLTSLCSCWGSLALPPSSLVFSIFLSCWQHLSVSVQAPLLLAWTLLVTSDRNSNQNWLKLQKGFFGSCSRKVLGKLTVVKTDYKGSNDAPRPWSLWSLLSSLLASLWAILCQVHVRVAARIPSLAISGERNVLLPQGSDVDPRCKPYPPEIGGLPFLDQLWPGGWNIPIGKPHSVFLLIHWGVVGRGDGDWKGN